MALAINLGIGHKLFMTKSDFAQKMPKKKSFMTWAKEDFRPLEDLKVVEGLYIGLYVVIILSFLELIVFVLRKEISISEQNLIIFKIIALIISLAIVVYTYRWHKYKEYLNKVK